MLTFAQGYPASWVSQVALVVKNPPANTGDVRDAGSISGSGRSLEKGMATISSIRAWRVPMDRGVWRAPVLRGTQSQTQL